MHLLRILLALGLTLGMAGAAGAGYIPPVAITGSGSYNNSATLIIDGALPAEGTSLQDHSLCAWWTGTTPFFVVDLGGQYQVQDIVVQVDNNDNYR